MSRRGIITHTFHYNDTPISIKGHADTVAELKELIDFRVEYLRLIQEMYAVLAKFVQNHDLYGIAEHIQQAREIIQEVDDIVRIAPVRTTPKSAVEYESSIFDLQESIRKKEELLQIHRDAYANDMSPYKEGDAYKTLKGMVYISQVKASRKSPITPVIYGVSCGSGESVDAVIRRKASIVKPDATWKKV